MSKSLGWSWLRTISALVAPVKSAVGLLQTQKLREEAREEKHQLAKDKRLTWQQKVGSLCQAKKNLSSLQQGGARCGAPVAGKFAGQPCVLAACQRSHGADEQKVATEIKGVLVFAVSYFSEHPVAAAEGKTFAIEEVCHPALLLCDKRDLLQCSAFDL